MLHSNKRRLKEIYLEDLEEFEKRGLINDHIAHSIIEIKEMLSKLCRRSME